MPQIYCLFDTNAIIKYYHDEKGSEVVRFLLDKSPNITPNIANTQVVEVVSACYRLQDRGTLTSSETQTIVDTFLKDIGNGLFRLYEYTNDHLADLEPVMDRIMQVPQPLSIYKPNGKKDRCSALDTIMLLILREMHYLLENKECYLVASDEHALDVAKSFNINTIDPEHIMINGLPLELQQRTLKRILKHLKVICRDIENGNSLGSSSSHDIHVGGICIRHLEALTHGRQIKLKIEDHGSVASIEAVGEVIWNSEQRTGIRFTSELPTDFISSI